MFKKACICLLLTLTLSGCQIYFYSLQPYSGEVITKFKKSIEGIYVVADYYDDFSLGRSAIWQISLNRNLTRLHLTLYRAEKTSILLDSLNKSNTANSITAEDGRESYTFSNKEGDLVTFYNFFKGYSVRKDSTSTVFELDVLNGFLKDDTGKHKMIVKKVNNIYYINLISSASKDYWSVFILEQLKSQNLRFKYFTFPDTNSIKNLSIKPYKRDESIFDEGYIFNPNDQEFLEFSNSPYATATAELIRLSDDLRINRYILILVSPLLFFVILIIRFRKRKLNAQSQENPHKKEIKLLLSKNKLNDAFNLLRKNPKAFSNKKINMLEFNYKSAIDKYNMNLITHEELRKEEAKIVSAILDIVY